MDPAAIRATYSDLRLVKGRKVAVIHLEIPIEQAESFVAAFGMPNPAEEKWVALARLTTMAKSTETRSPRPFTDLRPSAQAALRGKEPAFQRFLEENYAEGALVSSEGQAAELTRTLCGVDSRSALDRNAEAAERWRQISSAYDVWRTMLGCRWHGYGA